MGDQPIPQTELVTPPSDAGLRCPQCDYNLTGLSEPRCPECGEAFDWEQVRRAAANPPRIYFERARGWWKVPGLFVTWATALFTPWIFARQIVQRVSPMHAVAFGAICFGSTPLAFFFGCDRDFLATWLTTAAIYIILQTAWLSLLDPSGWREPLATLRFWLLAGCYTSAVMVSECIQGPPPFDVGALHYVLSLDAAGWLRELRNLRLPYVICALQMVLWVASLGCCYYARLRRRHWPKSLILPAAVVVTLGTFVAYAVVFQHIGSHIYMWLD